MNAKSELIAAFASDLPAGIAEHLETPIPELTATTAPTDVDSAIIAQGTLAHNLNLIFKAFEGLTLAAIPMYIAQLNTVNQGMLLAGLEYLGGGGEIRILSPTGGGAYLGYFGVREGEWYTAQIVRGTVDSISVALSGVQDGDTFDLENTETDWTAEWATGMGTHTATFTATFADGTTAEKTVSFAVIGYPTTPANGGTIPVGQEVEFSIDTQGDVYDSVSVKVTDSNALETIVSLAFDEIPARWIGNILVAIEGAVSCVVTLLGAGIGAAVYQEIQLQAQPPSA